MIYLNLLVATCQLLHAVNLDRLAALAEVETQKRELETRVAERTARLTAANEAVLAADAAKSRFVARVSHEVRTPLNGVLGMAAMVLDGRLEPQVRRNVEVIRTSGLHLLDVINRLLDYSRLDRPLQASEIVEFDLDDLVDEVLEEARCLPYAEGLALRREDAPGLATWRRGYRQGLRQMLTNLVGNAAKFTDRGSVTVRLKPLAGDGAADRGRRHRHRHGALGAGAGVSRLRAGGRGLGRDATAGPVSASRSAPRSSSGWAAGSGSRASSAPDRASGSSLRCLRWPRRAPSAAGCPRAHDRFRGSRRSAIRLRAALHARNHDDP